MNYDFTVIPLKIQNDYIEKEILKCNCISKKYGLTLNQKQITELIKSRSENLKKYGRIEFGSGIINKIIKQFCDSPYINQNDYFEILNELIEIFYYFKNESFENISDDELIEIMKKYFDNNCNGCIELLQNRELEQVIKNIRFGIFNYYNIEDESNEFLFIGDEDEYEQ